MSDPQLSPGSCPEVTSTVSRHCWTCASVPARVQRLSGVSGMSPSRELAEPGAETPPLTPPPWANPVFLRSQAIPESPILASDP